MLEKRKEKPPISSLEKQQYPILFFWRRAEKNAFAQAGESSLLQERQAREIFCSQKVELKAGGLLSEVFFFGPQDTCFARVARMSLVLVFLVSLHLSIYVRRACKKRRRRLGIECARVEGQTVV